MAVTVNVLYFPGTNCQRETTWAFDHVGAKSRVVFFTDVCAGKERLDSADILCIPGGFAHGDHVGAGTIGGMQLSTRFAEQLARCRQRLLICICNGFQIGTRAGLFGPGVALTTNASGTFNHVHDQPHVVDGSNQSPWLAGLAGQTLRFPCAHGEGRFLFNQRDAWHPALHYPEGQNPDGSTENLAGITTTDGLVFGLMNHPERAPRDPLNLAFFRNGVVAARS